MMLFPPESMSNNPILLTIGVFDENVSLNTFDKVPSVGDTMK